ncbi:MAG: alpha/beta hydrolase [Bacilli bacterium]|nr:alpha/beta hydrolase [Bacilli bacterium]
MYIKINNLNIYYEKHGVKEQTIIILPGWGDNRNTFSNLITFLKNYFTVYILDYPGLGNSTFKETLTIFDYADLVNTFIKKLHIENSILIGHSFGGRIISLLTTNYNIKFKKIILIDVAGLKEHNIKLFFKTYIYKLLKKLKYVLPNKLKIKYQNYLFKKFASTDYQNLNPKLSKTFQNIVKIDLKKYYQKINIDTLIIWGEKDNITPIKMAYKLNKLIKTSFLIKLDNLYHFPYLENPYLISQIIYNYLKKDII